MVASRRKRRSVAAVAHEKTIAKTRSAPKLAVLFLMWMGSLLLDTSDAVIVRGGDRGRRVAADLESGRMKLICCCALTVGTVVCLYL